MEYNSLIDLAIKEKDSLRRLAYIAAYSTTLLTSIERNSTKPFNPLLGETFEMVTPGFRFIAEQVSHHPPVTAFHCMGNSGYRVWTCNRAKTKFTGKNLTFTQMFNCYVELPEHNEKYEIQQPVISAHNLIIGSPYVDLGGKSVIRNCSREGEQCVLEYHKRGWTANSAFKADGEIFDSKNKCVYKVEANWSSKFVLINAKNPNDKEILWNKSPYPEKWEYMYGMSHFMIQLNYFPSHLERVVPPTDTRRRPD